MRPSGYEYSRAWFDFCFKNPEKVKPSHTALYFFCVEHCNRLGWKEKFGLPTTMAKEAIGIHSYNTYIKVLNDLIGFGFINLIQKSTNQYSSNIVSLSNYKKPIDKALDRALIKHDAKEDPRPIKKEQSTIQSTIQSTVQSTVQSIDSIVKQLTSNKEQLNKKNVADLKKLILDIEKSASENDYKKALLSEIEISDAFNSQYFEIAISFQKLFKRNLEEAGASVAIIEKAKGTWIDDVRLMIEKDGYTLEDLRDVYVFLQKDSFWKQNILSTSKLREQIGKIKLKMHNGKSRGNHQEATSWDQLAEIVKHSFEEG